VLDQGDPATIGRAIVLIMAEDTDLPPRTYRHEAWVELADGRRGPLIAPSDFEILPSDKPPAGTPAPLDGQPAPQTQSERNFRFTLGQTVLSGNTFAVTIPGAGMLRVTYTISGSIADLPPGGSYANVIYPDASRTQTAFVGLALGDLASGTEFDFHLRDRA